MTKTKAINYEMLNSERKKEQLNFFKTNYDLSLLIKAMISEIIPFDCKIMKLQMMVAAFSILTILTAFIL